MKKRLLSLALVLAMALTLLPTAAFAEQAAHEGSDGTPCGGTITWDTSIAGKHKGVCDVPGCPGIAEADHSYGDWEVSSESGSHSRTCSICGHKDSAGHTLEAIPAKDATCKEEGTRAFWTCSVCGKSFSDQDGRTETAPEEQVIAKLNTHTKGSTPEYTEGNGTKHTYKCTVCEQQIEEACSAVGETGQCVCGAVIGGGQDSEEPVPTATLTSLEMTGPSTAVLKVTLRNITAQTKLAAVLADSTKLADGDYTAPKAEQTVAAGAATAVFTFQGFTAGSYFLTLKTVVEGGDPVTLLEDNTSGEPRVLAYHAPSKPVTPPKPTVPEKPKDENKIPSTNSQGIPLASEVSTSKQAQAAVNILKNTNAGVLQERLMASESAASSFRSLERAVMSAKNIGVQVEVDRNAVPSAVRSGVDIDGAAFNAASSNTTVRLVVDAPSRAYYSFSGYQISMTLTGVPSAASLDVPVVITLPLPSDVSAGRVVVLHYHDGSSAPTAIIPAVSGNSIRFPVTGFSDFVVTDRDNSWSGPSGGGYLGGNVRKDNTDLSVILAIAAMLSGDGVFVDVPGDHWAAREIRWARDGGLMSGYEDGSFRPYATSTRQELWMVLARLAGARPADMAAAREWAVRTGVSDGRNPHSALSRQQLVTMLYRFAGSQGIRVSASANLGGYADGRAVASYAKDAFSWAVAKGIVGGDSNGRLNPEGTATRAHFAVLLCRYSSNGTA